MRSAKNHPSYHGPVSFEPVMAPTQAHPQVPAPAPVPHHRVVPDLAAVSQTTVMPNPTTCIREVWQGNLYQEMAQISQIVERYRFISVDTEFPGVVVTPLQSCNRNETSSYQWKTIRSNVNMYVPSVSCSFISLTHSLRMLCASYQSLERCEQSCFSPTFGNRCTLCSLKIIQLGITFSDQYGNKPPGVCTWQFNYHFDIKYVCERFSQL